MNDFTSAQKHAVEQAVEKAAIEYAKRTELRKWCIEQAIRYSDAITDSGRNPMISHLASEIYDFVRSE